ncbi:MAG: hypothetical protein JJ855_06630 [Rhodospirillales bacterium]|nr:hypothetical protein [Rhodospirillales bacterium]
MTPYPDAQLFDAVSNLQRIRGMRATGEVRPGDDTEQAIRTALDADSFGSSARAQNEGKYIWRTRGDSKVRSEHAERDGKVFEWNNPHEGGHPGEATNCRCRAEELESEGCERLRLQLEVDSHNFNAARSHWDKANDEVERISLKLAKLTHEMSEIVFEVRTTYGRFGLSILLGGKLRPDLPARLAKLLAEYVALEFEHADLGNRHEVAVAERDLKLRDTDAARETLRRTSDKLELQGCNK